MGVPTTRYATTRDGVSIAYQLSGDGELPLVVVHPWISNVEIYWEWPGYRDLMGGLGRRCRVLVFDKRGVGLSDRLVSVPTFDARLDDIVGVMDAVGWERAALFGYGDGAALAAAFAATHPDRTTCLVLEGSTPFRIAASAENPRGYTREQMEAEQELQRRIWGDETQAEAFSQLVDEGKSNIHRQPGFGTWFGRMLRYSAGRSDVERIERIWYETDATPVVDLIQAPTAFYVRTGWTAEERENARRLAALIPGARVIEAPGGGFAPWGPEADGMGEAVAAFVAAVHERETSYDRKLATVVFTDIVGSTEELARAGDAGWGARLEQHHRRTRAVIGRHHGREIDTAGDGFFAAFDGPGRAVAAGLDIVEALDTLGLRVRVGVHTGEVIEVDGKPSGLAVTIGARVAGFAAAGEVVVTGTVKDLVAGSGLAFAELGSRELKGVPGTWPLFRAEPREVRTR